MGKHESDKPYKPIIDEEDFQQMLLIHTKNEFPREFAHKTPKGKFFRNHYVYSVESLSAVSTFFECVDCYCSVFSFTDQPEDGRRWDRTTAVVDTIYLDFDHKENPSVALKETKKFVEWCFKVGATPRVYFSGAKGFNIYLDFPPIRQYPTDTLKKAVKEFVTSTSTHLKLKTIDTQVIDIARVSRIPLTINSKTNVLCTPINPEKLLNLTYEDVVHFAKLKKYNFPEVEESEVIKTHVEILALRISSRESVSERVRRIKQANRKIRGDKISFREGDRLHDLVKNAPNVDVVPEWMVRRALFYIDTLKRYGCLADSKFVRRIHSGNVWLASQKHNKGAIEHIARVHLVLILLQLGLSDKEIHEIFKLCKDYDYDRTQYYIDYNKKYLSQHFSL